MSKPLLRVENLRKWFPVRKGLIASLRGGEQRYVRAVDDVSFDIEEHAVFGLLGESGCGKTTTGRSILRLIEPSGKIYFKDTEILGLERREMKLLRKKMQIIYQDPYDSLHPRMTVLGIVAEPLRIHGVAGSQRVEELVAGALEEVDLVPPQEFMNRFPHELSGGQRQRLAIARALILKPEFIVADEPVSMLDVSLRAEILALMLRLREQYRISYLFITHDLAVARHMCDRAAIMYLGKIVEMGPMEDCVKGPLHPYNMALISAVPVPDPRAERSEANISGEAPNPMDPPPGCRFHPRCPYVMDVCRKVEPQLLEAKSGRHVACHLYS